MRNWKWWVAADLFWALFNAALAGLYTPWFLIGTGVFLMAALMVCHVDNKKRASYADAAFAHNRRQIKQIQHGGDGSTNVQAGEDVYWEG